MKTRQIHLLEPPELGRFGQTINIIQKYLPKQTDIDKILKIIQRKVLKGTHLPVTIKGVQVGYLNNPYFKDLYLYLAQNKLPNSKSAICKVEVLVERYILLVSLLFKLNTSSEKEKCTIRYTRNMCWSNNYNVSFRFVCWSPRCNKNILTYSRQILHSWPHALFMFLYKRLSHMSTF